MYHSTQNVRTRLFLDICHDCFLEYERYLKENNAIDFEDMINESARILREVKEMKKKLDSSEHGGAPLLGLRKPVIKAHGNSDAMAIKNAIRQAIACCESDMVGQISQSLAKVVVEEEQE
jgi:fatty acid/phospholipid biosynthesis enzyme